MTTPDDNVENYWSRCELQSGSMIELHLGDGSKTTKVIVCECDGSTLAASCYKDGKLRCAEGSFALLHRHYESVVNMSHYSDGKLHRDNGPAAIVRRHDGSIVLESYYRQGKLHRDDGPAIILRDENESIISESYYRDGLLHRDGGPAIVVYRSGGLTARWEGYYIDGKIVGDDSLDVAEDSERRLGWKSR